MPLVRMTVVHKQKNDRSVGSGQHWKKPNQSVCVSVEAVRFLLASRGGCLFWRALHCNSSWWTPLVRWEHDSLRILDQQVQQANLVPYPE